MKIIRRYMLEGFIVIFAGTLVFTTFTVSIGFLFKLTDLIARGVSWRLIGIIFLYSMPTSLSTGIPLSALIACLLLFDRLSGDGEIVAMQGLGLSMRQISGSVILVTGALVALCLYINHELEPAAHFGRRTTMAKLRSVSAVNLIESGRFFTLVPGLGMYVGSRNGTYLKEVRIYDRRGPGLARQIRAERGELVPGKDKSSLVLELEHVRVTPFSDEVSGPGYFGRWSVPIEGLGNARSYLKSEEDLGFAELYYALRHTRERYPSLPEEELFSQRVNLGFELNRRTAGAFSCLALVFLAIPLGIRAQRHAPGFGAARAIGIYMVFYVLNLLVQSLIRQPHFRPDLLILAPPILFAAIGTWLFCRRV